MFEILDGLLDATPAALALWTLAFTHLTIVSVTVFLHRAQAHRALELHPALAHLFRFWLWLTTGMVTRQWVAIHRKHHGKCETVEDPHSPQILGIRKVLFEGAELYRAESRNAETVEKYGHGTPDDGLERRVYTPWSKYGIFLMLATDLVLFGVAGLTVWAVQMLWIPVFAAGVINGIGHYWGYRNYECADAATNIVPWGILIGGEELHNNHHAFPGSARLSSKRWEFDIGWMYIRLFGALGLARVRKVAPETRVVPGKTRVDMDTLRAVVTGRMYVLAAYAREVILPVLREEARRTDASARRLLRRARGVLVRETTLLDASGQRQLDGVLGASEILATVYQFRLRLQAVWSRTAASHEHLLEALQRWCQEAEATGIEALQEFAASLRGYTLKGMPG
jgi:stearoyl-CoA desaturase (delta-9 desaturase)